MLAQPGKTRAFLMWYLVSLISPQVSQVLNRPVNHRASPLLSQLADQARSLHLSPLHSPLIILLVSRRGSRQLDQQCNPRRSQRACLQCSPLASPPASLLAIQRPNQLHYHPRVLLHSHCRRQPHSPARSPPRYQHRAHHVNHLRFQVRNRQPCLVLHQPRSRQTHQQVHLPANLPYIHRHHQPPSHRVSPPLNPPMFQVVNQVRNPVVSRAHSPLYRLVRSQLPGRAVSRRLNQVWRHAHSLVLNPVLSQVHNQVLVPVRHQQLFPPANPAACRQGSQAGHQLAAQQQHRHGSPVASRPPGPA